MEESIIKKAYKMKSVPFSQPHTDPHLQIKLLRKDQRKNLLPPSFPDNGRVQNLKKTPLKTFIL